MLYWASCWNFTFLSTFHYHTDPSRSCQPSGSLLSVFYIGIYPKINVCQPPKYDAHVALSLVQRRGKLSSIDGGQSNDHHDEIVDFYFLKVVAY